MVRRVVFPAMLAVGVWLAVSLAGLLQEGWLLARNPPALALLLIPRSLSWVIFVGTFLALHLCVARGGSRREAILVGMSPLLATSPAAFQLLLGPLVALVRGPASREALGVTHGYFTALSSVIGLAGTCLAAIWMYFFMARQMRGRPSSAVVEQ